MKNEELINQNVHVSIEATRIIEKLQKKLTELDNLNVKEYYNFIILFRFSTVNKYH